MLRYILTTIAGMAAAIASAALSAPPSAQEEGSKQRLIVLTDVENEPDDTQSLVRLLLYANEIDIEGIVATTSVHMKSEVHPESIHKLLAAYAKVRPSLLHHATGYPEAASLGKRVVAGQPGYGMTAVGAGKDSDGSRMIVRALEAADPRPVWVTAWGGPNTLAQALHTIRETKTPSEAQRLIAKLRVYTISDQDDSGAWMRKTFPGLFYIVSPGGYGAATWTGIMAVVDGIDNSTISNRWLAANIQQDHGPLGSLYPDVAYGMEGDTPSFLGLIPNGLSVPEHPEWGGWGGRYVLGIPQLETLDPKGFNGGVPIEPETRPIWTNTPDKLSLHLPSDYGRAVKRGEQSFSDFRATIWRWRDAFQNDFAARMDWTVQPYDNANHPPVARLDHADRLTVRSGERFRLSAAASSDPDGDSLSYLWFHYPEAGSWKEPILSEGSENIYRVGFRAPEVTKAETAHFILALTDKGSPALTRYRRVMVTIEPR